MCCHLISDYAARGRVQVPAFPTSTIGSFPQTKALRAARAGYKAGRLSEAEYKQYVDAYIAHCIGVQEGLGIDVLVHGEPERTDMCASLRCARPAMISPTTPSCTRPKAAESCATDAETHG